MNKLKISVASKLDNIHLVENFIEHFSAHFDLPAKLYGSVNLSVIEAFSNAVKYDNSRNLIKEITVAVEKIKHQFQVIVSNEWKNETKKPISASSKNINKESKHGLFLMNELSDDLIFEKNGAMVTIIFDLKK